jgi:hypothetical protein
MVMYFLNFCPEKEAPRRRNDSHPASLDVEMDLICEVSGTGAACMTAEASQMSGAGIPSFLQKGRRHLCQLHCTFIQEIGNEAEIQHKARRKTELSIEAVYHRY